MTRHDAAWMAEALTYARRALESDDVPVGAVIVQADAVIAGASNRTLRDQDPTGHAELLAIRDAAQRLGRWRLDDRHTGNGIESSNLSLSAWRRPRFAPDVIFAHSNAPRGPPSRAERRSSLPRLRTPSSRRRLNAGDSGACPERDPPRGRPVAD